jgi:hypothetical protein
MSPHDVYLITPQLHPGLFAAFELISHDCGRQAGHKNYAVPLEWVERIEKNGGIDDRLNELRQTADSDFECLCIGDEDESKRVVAGYGLQDADELLQRFFEEFS